MGCFEKNDTFSLSFIPQLTNQPTHLIRHWERATWLIQLEDTIPGCCMWKGAYAYLNQFFISREVNIRLQWNLESLQLFWTFDFIHDILKNCGSSNITRGDNMSELFIAELDSVSFTSQYNILPQLFFLFLPFIVDAGKMHLTRKRWE